MTFIFRADGNAKIGVGHLMRCLSVAKVMPNKEDVLFVCADVDSAQIVIQHGLKAIALHTDYKNMDEEIPVFEKIWKNIKKITFLVDSYYVTDTYLEYLRKYGKVFLMDDMQNHAYPVDGIINYNLYANMEVYNEIYKDVERKPAYYLGGKYIPLRSQFNNRKIEIADIVNRVLITTGGGDVDNIAGEILDVIYRPGINYLVIVGKFSPHWNEWVKRSNEQTNVKVLHDVQNMAELMQNCDLAVTAGGSTIYELSALGVPFICFAYAANQEMLVQYIDDNQISASAGKWHTDQDTVRKTIKKLFCELVEYKEKREEYSKKMYYLVDGSGADRIVEKLIETK